ncbi:MAG TPA: hypothetical protein VFQ44_06750 [Streptosporangiaceae bacterium]|nr:hypothetical protein [Streptosporangiaceae bacterium]
MINDRAQIWPNTYSRMQEACKRYLDSLEAIHELAEFATEHVVKLDEKRPAEIHISIGTPDARDPERHRSIFVQFLRGFAARLAEETQDGKPMVIEFARVFEGFTEEFKDKLPDEAGDFDITLEVDKPRGRTDLLLASLLIAAVSDFEVLFSSIASSFFRMHPEALKAHDTKIAWSEIEAYESLDDLRSHFIDDRVDRLMREGFDDWMKWLESQLKIRFENASLNPDRTIEIFQRRHIIVHNGGNASVQYLSRVPSARSTVAVGTPLPVSIEYLESALDMLTVIGVSITYLVARKLCPTESQHQDIDNDVLRLTFRLLCQHKWQVVETVSTISLPEMKHEYDRCAVRVNRWIALKYLNSGVALLEEVRQWDVSALQGIFSVAQKALLDDPSAADAAIDLIKLGDLSQEQIDTWPLFDNIRGQILDLLSAKSSEET